MEGAIKRLIDFDSKVIDTYKEIIKTQEKMIENLEVEVELLKQQIEFLRRVKVTKWIPVSEGLPEKGQWVLVTHGSRPTVCLVQDDYGAVQENSIDSWLYPEPEWGDGYTAWMPLPKPHAMINEYTQMRRGEN